MTPLEYDSGLPLTVAGPEEDFELRLDGRLLPGTPSVRRLGALEPMLCCPPALSDRQREQVLYRMYRGVVRATATLPWSDRPLDYRYDITVFRPGSFGGEYLKTSGHYHPPVPGRDLSYPEVYEVLHGSVLFVLQETDNYLPGPQTIVIRRLVLLRAQAGQKAVMPPNFGHWSINTDPARPLVMANWISDGCVSHYASVERARGAAVYVCEGEGIIPGEPVRLVRNARYAHVPAEVEYAVVADQPDLGLTREQPMLGALLAAPARWAYLCDPTGYGEPVLQAIRILRQSPLPAAAGCQPA